jgi:pyrroloquinoline quinone biosynthesis protein D
MTEPGPPVTARPRLAPHVRLRFDQARQRYVLLTPEAVTVLNDTGAAVLGLCDGQRTLAEIVAALKPRYNRVPGAEVERFLNQLALTGRLDINGG